MSALSLGQIEVWRSLICNLTRWRQKQRIVVVEDPLNHLHNLHLFRYTFFTICLVPVRRFPSPSRSIRFGDVSKANGRETASHFRTDHVTRNALAAKKNEA